ncbi:MAG: hypothetical protein JW987_13735 [Anaerolineaceae bacterium]|nr:hypothetical protein [Anaerolineaceae bacterium]
MGRILKRCDVCKRFHAAYVVDDPLYPGGKANYCFKCWKKKFGDAPPPKEQSGETLARNESESSDPKGLKDH